jgi:antitoxin component of RelBE/YafQ-DinJ toxin-antitoxin module
MTNEYTIVNIKIDKEIQEKATQILNNNGMTIDQYINLILKFLVENKGSDLGELLNNAK